MLFKNQTLSHIPPNTIDRGAGIEAKRGPTEFEDTDRDTTERNAAKMGGRNPSEVPELLFVVDV